MSKTEIVTPFGSGYREIENARNVKLRHCRIGKVTEKRGFGPFDSKSLLWGVDVSKTELMGLDSSDEWWTKGSSLRKGRGLCLDIFGLDIYGLS